MPLDLSSLKPGVVLGSKYRVERVLGQGGMGVVVLAQHLDLDEKVALKFLLPDHARHPEAAQRFLREARAAVKIKSKHVARVRDVGRLDDDVPFLVMDFLEGADLHAVLREHGPLGIEDAVDYVVQASEALAEAHSIGIVHRDLKPANLFLARHSDGRLVVKVLDFGISKVMGEGVEVLTRTSAAMGSTPYMSPEQMESSRDVDHRTDVYSLGVTLYELVSGRWPFQAESVPQLCAMVLSGAATPLHEVRADVPPGLERVIRNAFARDRADRPASMAAFAEALAPFAPARSAATLATIAELDRTGARSSEPAASSRDFSTAPTALQDKVAPTGSPSVVTSGAVPARAWTRTRRLGVALAFATCAIAAAAASRHRLAGPAVSPSVSASATVAAPARGAVAPGLKYLSAPKTTSAEAAREFALGARGNYDGDGGFVAHLRRALAADPNLAVAHLWLAIGVRGVSPDEARREFAAAWSVRDQLPDYERALARATEPLIVPDPPDYLAVRERLLSAVAKWPDDTILLNNLAYAEMQTGHLDRAIAAAQRGLAQDPEHRAGMANLAHYFTLAGRFDAAIAVLDRCLDLDRATPFCLAKRLALRDATGACSAYESDARQLALAAPGDRSAATTLANALAASGQPTAAVEQALETAWSVAPEEDRGAISARDRAALAVLRGDLEGAIEALEPARDWPLRAALPQRFEMVTRLRLGVLRELGRTSAAAVEARSLSDRLSALSGRMNAAVLSMSLDPVPVLLDVELEAGALDGAGRAQGRTAWLDEWKRWLGADNPQRVYLWVYGWAEPVRTEADAKEALAELRGYGALPRFVPTTAGRAAIGRTYLLAGDGASALPWLEAAAHSCTPIDDPIAWVRARFDLGRALEVKGDSKGACEAYGFVAARWGAAKPKSVTGDAAKARIEALGCPH